MVRRQTNIFNAIWIYEKELLRAHWIDAKECNWIGKEIDHGQLILLLVTSTKSNGSTTAFNLQLEFLYILFGGAVSIYTAPHYQPALV